jgi:hypothetical protein
MGLLPKQTQQLYYNTKKSFTGDGTVNLFELNIYRSAFEGAIPNVIALPSSADVSDYLEQNSEIRVDGTLQLLEDINGNANYYFFENVDGWWIVFTSPPANGANITFVINNPIGLGSYQFISLDDIISNFMISYVGDGKIISKVRRYDVAFHAQRALAELSFDTFKSTKSQEIEIPASLTMMLPHDYVNYVKLTWNGDNGIERIIYPASKTSNPKAINQNSDGSYNFDIDGDGIPESMDLTSPENSDTWDSYKSGTIITNNVDLDDEAIDIDLYDRNKGQRYGIDPQYAQANGSFFIDELKGLIHFSSNLSGKTVILKYISDSLGTDAEMQVHKLAEEAMYKSIAYAVLSTKANIPEYIVQRFKKERFAEVRKAKLRLSNIKLEEITQILRGKSKWIKH